MFYVLVIYVYDICDALHMKTLITKRQNSGANANAQSHRNREQIQMQKKTQINRKGAASAPKARTEAKMDQRRAR